MGWVLLLLSCSAPMPQGGEGIVVTTGILGDAVRQIVHNDVPVRVLMGPGVDPHLFKPTPQDVESLQRAACVVAHGLRLEGKMEDILRALARRVPVVFAAERLPGELLRLVGPQTYDPHLWQSVRLWRMVVEQLADTLAVLFPQWGELWRKRARQYGRRLENLDAWVREQVAQIPPQRRLLITMHDAFAYFGREYGLRTVALQGISTTTEFGLRDMIRIADTIVARKVSAVFVESTIPPRLMENVVQMARLRGASVRIAGQLYSDALGAVGSGAETYEGMIRANVESIVRGLRGEMLP